MDFSKETKETKIVVYDNKINFSLEGISAKNTDIIMSAAYKLKEQGSNVIEVDYREIMTLANFKHMSFDDFHEYLKDNKTSFLTVTLWDTRDEQNNLDGVVIFTRFSANKQKHRITLQLNPLIKDTFSSIHPFTSLDLAIHTTLKSKYAKTLYRNLCQYRQANGKGFWSIPLEDGVSEKQPIGFKTLFEVPRNLSQKYIKRDIIKPAINELAPYMNIECTTILKGRKTIGYRFDFKNAQNATVHQNNSTTESGKSKTKKIRELTAQEKEEYNNLAEHSEQMLLEFNENEEQDLQAQISVITKLDGLSCKIIETTAKSNNVNDEDVLKICRYAAAQPNVKNLASYIFFLLQNGFSEPKATDVKQTQTAKQNKFNDFPQRSYDYAELEKQLLGNKKEG